MLYRFEYENDYSLAKKGFTIFCEKLFLRFWEVD